MDHQNRHRSYQSTIVAQFFCGNTILFCGNTIVIERQNTLP